MRKILLLCPVILLVMAAGAHAGGLAEPVMEPELVEAATATSAGGVVVALLLLLVIAAAASNGGGGGI